MTQLKHITIIMMILASLYGVYPAQAKSGSFQTVLTAVVSIESGQVSQNGDVTVKVTAAVGAGANLGAATIEVSYDPSVVQVKTCTPDPGGVLNAKQCNPAYAANKLRFNVASTSGLTGTVQLAELTFHAIATSGAAALTVLPVVWVDAAGTASIVTPQHGQITIVSGTATVSIGSGQVGQDRDVTVMVTAAVAAGAKLGAATIEVLYDPSVVQVKTCTPDPDGVMSAEQCNPAYAANKLRFNVAATYGLTGTVQLARLTFHSIASSGATDLTILPVAFVDAAGGGISAAPRDGQITILSLSPLVWLPFIAR